MKCCFLFLFSCLLLTVVAPLAFAESVNVHLEQSPGMVAMTQPLPDNDQPDIKEPIEIVDNSRTILLVLILALVASFLLILFLWLKKRGKKKRFIPAHDIALQRLLPAQQLIDDHQVDTFVLLIDQTLRNYIYDRFAIHAREQTTREFITNLTDGEQSVPSLLAENRASLQTWLAHCDMVKFAKATLTTEVMKEMVTNLRTFIESTRQEPEKG